MGVRASGPVGLRDWRGRWISQAEKAQTRQIGQSYWQLWITSISGVGPETQVRDCEVRSDTCCRRWSKAKERSWVGSVKDVLDMAWAASKYKTKLDLE